MNLLLCLWSGGFKSNVGAVRYSLELIINNYQMQNSVTRWTQIPNRPQL